MKQRPSRKPNQIYEHYDRPNDHKLPPLALNPSKQPQNFYEPPQNGRSWTSAGISTIESAAEGVEELLLIYEWRGQTDYPVVRAGWKKVCLNQITFTINNRPELIAFLHDNALRQNAIIQVETELVTPLQFFQPLPITQFLYAVKEAFIAFERLYSLFGAYSVTPNMIAVNADGKVKVWLHSQYHLNNKVEGPHLEAADLQSRIVDEVRRAVAGCAQDSLTLRQFMEEAGEIHNFIDFIKHIHDFSQNRKIIIGTRIVKKQETPGNHPKRPFSPVPPFRPTSRIASHPFKAHLSIAPNQAPYFANGPELALVSRKSVKEPFHFQAMQTKETLNPQRSKASTEAPPSGSQPAPQYGKIVKNRLNVWLINSKSLENLPRFSPPSIERYMEPHAPNSIEKTMNRLFEEDPPRKEKYASKLMQLGRSVKESLINE